MQYFRGRREELPSWLVRMKAHFELYQADYLDEDKKVLFAIQHLRGWPYRLFSVDLEDYLDQKHEDRKESTKRLFESFAEFEKQLGFYIGKPVKNVQRDGAFH